MNLSLTPEQVEALVATLFESRSGLPGAGSNVAFRDAASLSRPPHLEFGAGRADGYNLSAGYQQQHDGGAQLHSIAHQEAATTVVARPADSQATSSDDLVNDSTEAADQKFVRRRPGPKPSTREPATKRRAQNRAAQRAYRERKETHIKDLEETNENLLVMLESEKKENSALRAKILKMGLELRARSETAEPSRESDLSIAPSSIRDDHGDDPDSSSVSTSPISPEMSHKSNLRRSTATSETSMSSSWVPKPSHEYQQTSSHSSQLLQFPFLPDSGLSGAALASGHHAQYGDSYFNMVNPTSNPSQHAMGSRESHVRVKSELASSSAYRPQVVSRGNSIVSHNISQAASGVHWGSNSVFNNAQSEAARHAGIYMHQFQAVDQTHGGRPFDQLNPEGTAIMDKWADWSMGHLGTISNTDMFIDHRYRLEKIEFGGGLYESNHSENSRVQKSPPSTLVTNAQRDENIWKGKSKGAKQPAELKLVASASLQLWNTLWSNWHLAEVNNNNPVLEGLCKQLEAQVCC